MSAEELKNKGNNFYKNNNFYDAIKCYTEAIELSNHSSPVYYGNRAQANLAIGSKSSLLEAISDSEKCIQLDNTFVRGYQRMAKSYIMLGRYQEAESIIEQGLKVDPSSKELLEERKTLNELKSSLQHIQNSSELPSLTKVEHLLSLSKFNKKLIITKIKILLQLKQFSQALTLSTSLVQEDSMNPEYLYLRGLSLYYQNNLTSAAQHFQNSLTYDPDYSASRIALKRLRSLESKKKEGNEAFSAKNYQAAVDSFTEILNVDPSFDTFNSQIYCNRAAAYSQLNKVSEAIQDCSKAIELDPSYTKAYIRRAQFYRKQERYEEAVRDFEKASQLDPENKEYTSNLKEAKAELKKSQRKDYYKTLGVPKDADDDQIKKAYRKLAVQYHPDKNTQLPDDEKAHAEKMFKDIGEAYGCISDPKKRQRYDMGQDENGMPFDYDGEASNVDVSNIFNMFFNGGMGGMGGMGGGMGGGMPGGFSFGSGGGGMGGGMPGGFSFDGMGGGMGGMPHFHSHQGSSSGGRKKREQRGYYQ